MIPICVFTNPALRFVYVGYCGVLDHCFECTEERIQAYCCSVLFVQFEITQFKKRINYWTVDMLHSGSFTLLSSKRTFDLEPSINSASRSRACRDMQRSEGPAGEQQWRPLVVSCTEGAIQENTKCFS